MLHLVVNGRRYPLQGIEGASIKRHLVVNAKKILYSIYYITH